MKAWVYLSHVLDEDSPSYGNRGGMKIEQEGRRWSLPNHLGTHVDAPSHFVPGTSSLDVLAPAFWHFSRPLILDCPKGPGDAILPADLEPAIALAPDALLVRTGFERVRSERQYWEDNPGVSEAAALWLREKLPSVRLLGLDVLSVTRWRNREEGRAAHRALLRPPDFVIVEDMKLSGADFPLSELLVLPLRVKGADGGPCTVLGRRG